ncbi:hypothetical protein pipiens_000406, partial [Culex pipiens pipiens]
RSARNHPEAVEPGSARGRRRDVLLRCPRRSGAEHCVEEKWQENYGNAVTLLGDRVKWSFDVANRAGPRRPRRRPVRVHGRERRRRCRLRRGHPHRLRTLPGQTHRSDRKWF